MKAIRDCVGGSLSHELSGTDRSGSVVWHHTTLRKAESISTSSERKRVSKLFVDVDSTLRHHSLQLFLQTAAERADGQAMVNGNAPLMAWCGTAGSVMQLSTPLDDKVRPTSFRPALIHSDHLGIPLRRNQEGPHRLIRQRA